jgi:hypothetical protein
VAIGGMLNPEIKADILIIILISAPPINASLKSNR